VVGAGVAKPVGARRAAGKAAHLTGRAAGQNRSGGAGGVLNGARVVILVARQGGTPRKCLLAVGVRAFVGALAGVDAAMAGQGAGVAKGLAAALALVRLLAGVDAAVDGQGGALDKLLATAGEVADMGADASMNPFWEELVREFKSINK
jgi:hypothetical protein